MRKFLCVVILACLVSIMCSGCSAKSQEIKQTKQETTEKSTDKVKYLEGNLSDSDNSYNIISKGKYYIFSCKTSDEYVMFLDELDENVYEIVDIQIEHFTDGNFWVTYKKK